MLRAWTTDLFQNYSQVMSEFQGLDTSQVLFLSSSAPWVGSIYALHKLVRGVLPLA